MSDFSYTPWGPETTDAPNKERDKIKQDLQRLIWNVENSEYESSHFDYVVAVMNLVSFWLQNRDYVGFVLWRGSPRATAWLGVDIIETGEGHGDHE